MQIASLKLIHWHMHRIPCTKIELNWSGLDGGIGNTTNPTAAKIAFSCRFFTFFMLQSFSFNFSVAFCRFCRFPLQRRKNYMFCNDAHAVSTRCYLVAMQTNARKPSNRDGNSYKIEKVKQEALKTDICTQTHTRARVI